MVLRTAQLLDDYSMLGKKRQQQIQQEVSSRTQKMQHQKQIVQNDFENIVSVFKQSNLRTQHTERDCVRLQSEIETLHRARLNQLAALQNSTDHLKRVQSIMATAETELHQSKQMATSIDARRYAAEQSYGQIIQQTNQTKTDLVALNTACRHKQSDLDRLQHRMVFGRWFQ